MREFIVTGVVQKVEQKTSKMGSPYSIILIEDKEGVIEVIAGSKVEVPPQGSFVLCRGFIKSTPRDYQGKTYYSYSFSAFVIEVANYFFRGEKVEENSLQEVSFSEEEMPF